jgi:metal-sulfur cluster biosynthetic enzyme
MVTDEQLKENLNEVIVPGVMRSLVQMNLLRDVTVTDKTANIVLASAAFNDGVQQCD